MLIFISFGIRFIIPWSRSSSGHCSVIIIWERKTHLWNILHTAKTIILHFLLSRIIRLCQTRRPSITIRFGMPAVRFPTTWPMTTCSVLSYSPTTAYSAVWSAPSCISPSKKSYPWKSQIPLYWEKRWPIRNFVWISMSIWTIAPWSILKCRLPINWTGGNGRSCIFAVPLTIWAMDRIIRRQSPPYISDFWTIPCLRNGRNFMRPINW